MSRERNNADKAPETTTQVSNVPSIGQEEEVVTKTKEEVAPTEVVVIETTEEKESEKYPEVVSIEMGFKEEVAPTNPNDVNFKVKYKKDFKGVKRHIEGSVLIISKESAEMFEEKGIGHILK